MCAWGENDSVSYIEQLGCGMSRLRTELTQDRTSLDEYCRLRKEVKQLVIEKMFNIWNEFVEKVKIDFDEKSFRLL